MNLEVNIPDNVFRHGNPDVSREVLEAVAIEGFKSGQLTLYQVRRILGFETRFEVHQFLVQHDIPWVNYSMEDLERESETLKELLGR